MTTAESLAIHLKQYPGDKKVPNLFFSLIGPWILDYGTINRQQTNGTIDSHDFAISRNFPAPTLAQMFWNIFDEDVFLRQCCVDCITFIFYLDQTVMLGVTDSVADGLDRERISQIYDAFESATYNDGPFRRVGFTHIFNLSLEAKEIEPSEGVVLRTLSTQSIAALFNEKSITQESFLHPANVGNVFFVTQQESTVDGDDLRWIFEQRNLAHDFCLLLQYLKDGIVSVGYSGIHFNPPWVNSLRKHGLLFYGEPRRISYKNGEDTYSIRDNEIPFLRGWLAVTNSDSFKDTINDLRNDLSMTIERAGTAFVRSHDRIETADRVVTLAIALEALFSPSDQGEMGYRIAQGAAILLGETIEERKIIFQNVKKMYGIRSKLVHGQYDLEKYRNGSFVSEELLREWASYLRRSITAFIILRLKGMRRRDEILDLLRDSCLSDKIGDDLRERADASTYLAAFIKREM